LLYFFSVALLTLMNLVAWATNLVMLPGNWIVVGLTALFVWLGPPSEHGGIGWVTVAVAAGMAGLGEVVEFVAGAAGAAQRKASRRALLLAILGAILGSIGGAMLGLPVPIVGSLVAAVAGGAAGAFIGAYAGEQWAGRPYADSMEVGKAAFWGRLWGTFGKLIIGAVMVVAITIDAVL